MGIRSTTSKGSLVFLPPRAPGPSTCSRQERRKLRPRQKAPCQEGHSVTKLTSQKKHVLELLPNYSAMLISILPVCNCLCGAHRGRKGHWSPWNWMIQFPAVRECRRGWLQTRGTKFWDGRWKTCRRQHTEVASPFYNSSLQMEAVGLDVST